MRISIPKKLNSKTGCHATTGHGQCGGFTLVELLVVLVSISILAALLLPAISKARSRALSAACLNNLRQQQVGWHLYTADNDDAVPANNYGDSQAVTTSPDAGGIGLSWCPGAAPTDTSDTNIKSGVIYSYIRSPAVFHCPGDSSTVTGQSGMLRTRSYCMNISLDCNDVTGSFVKQCSIIVPSPSSLFVLIDTHEQSIWDSTFGIFSADSAYANLWLDLPADRHLQGANLSLADGHVEHWRWNAAKQFKEHRQAASSTADLADLQRLQQSTKLGLD